MTVGIRLKLAGVTAAKMDELNAAIDPEGNPPDGLVFHASGPIEGGWGAIDFWKSREHFDRFAANASDSDGRDRSTARRRMFTSSPFTSTSLTRGRARAAVRQRQ